MVHQLFRLFLWSGSEWILWLLIGASVLSLGVILDRLRHLRGQERVGNILWNQVGKGWLNSGAPQGWQAEAPSFAGKYPCPEGRLVALLAQTHGKPAADRERIVNSFLAAERAQLEKNLSILGTLGNSAPFIGLLGTVLGIIRAFYDLGKADGGGGLATVSGGLAEALVTTAMGLLVALPSAMAFNYFQRKIKAVSARVVALAGLVIGER